MRPLNNMFENLKKKIIFNSFTYTFLDKQYTTNTFKSHFCLSNVDYFGPKTNINFHLEVDDIFSTHLTTLPPDLK